MLNKFKPKNRNKLANEWRRQKIAQHYTIQELGLDKEDIVTGCFYGIVGVLK